LKAVVTGEKGQCSTAPRPEGHWVPSEAARLREPRLLPRAMEEVASKTEALFRALLSGLCIMCEICDDLQVGVAAIAGHREVKMNGSSLRPLREGSTRVNDLAAACLKASGVLKSVFVLNTSGVFVDHA